MPPDERNPRRRLALPGVAWLAAGACAFAPLSGAVKRALADELTLYGGVFAVGLAVAFVLGPLAAAWAVGRWAPARVAWQAPVFYVTLAVLLGGVAWNAARQTGRRDEVIAAQAGALASDLKQSATSGVAAGGGRGGTVAVSGGSNAVNEAIVAAQRATKAHLYAAQLAYENAADAVALPAFLDPRPLTSRETIAERRADVETYAKAVRMFREAGELMAFQFSSELRDRQVPESAVREVVAAYREATEKALPRLNRLREKDAAIALLLEQFLDFAEAERGGWSVRTEDGKETVVFDRPEAQGKYDELVRTAKVLEAERRTLRAEAAK